MSAKIKLTSVTYQQMDSPIGELLIVACDGRLASIRIGEEPEVSDIPDLPKRPTPHDPLLKTAVEQLQEYFDGRRTRFTVPHFRLQDSFQHRVWRALTRIPYGETRSYADVSQAVAGNRRSGRAVGNANGRNPLPIIIPCHRVLLSNGDLGGFSCGTWRKEILLALEQKHSA